MGRHFLSGLMAAAMLSASPGFADPGVGVGYDVNEQWAL